MNRIRILGIVLATGFGIGQLIGKSVENHQKKKLEALRREKEELLELLIKDQESLQKLIEEMEKGS